MSKAPAQIKSLARVHTETALNVLAGIMRQEDCAPAARVAAANSLLDRGWGKPAQTIGGDPENPLQQVIRWAAPKEAIADPSKKDICNPTESADPSPGH